MKRPTHEQIMNILHQMKDKKRIFIDYSKEYEDGLNISYEFDTQKDSFICTEIDIVVGGYYEVTPLSEEEILDALAEYTLQDFIDSNFEV